jgi:HAD superfamily hydrolase (TIGR01549 family)
MREAMIFDIDGTLIDTVDLHARAWIEIFEKFGVDAGYDGVRAQIGKGGDQLLPVFLDERTIQAKGKQIEEERSNLFLAKYFPHARPFAQVRDLFVALRKRSVRIAVASSCKGSELPRYTELAGIAGLIEVAATSDDVERSKPHPDIFAAALHKLDGIAADRVLAVGDTPYDAEAAAKAGIETLGMLCGGFPEADLRAAGCVKMFRDPADLLSRLDEVLPQSGAR